MSNIDYPMMCDGRVTEIRGEKEAKMNEINDDEGIEENAYGIHYSRKKSERLGLRVKELEENIKDFEGAIRSWRIVEMVDKERIKELESERDSETRWAKQYFDQWEEAKARIKELEEEKKGMVRLTKEDMKKLGWIYT